MSIFKLLGFPFGTLWTESHTVAEVAGCRGLGSEVGGAEAAGGADAELAQDGAAAHAQPPGALLDAAAKLPAHLPELGGPG